MPQVRNKRAEKIPFHKSFDSFLKKNFILIALFFLMSTLVIVISGGMTTSTMSATSRAALPLEDLKQSVFGSGENQPVCNRDKIWKWWCGATKDDCVYCRKIITRDGVRYELQSCNDDSQLGKGYLLQCGFVPMQK